jgi:nitrous oxidase accessory protein
VKAYSQAVLGSRQNRGVPLWWAGVVIAVALGGAATLTSHAGHAAAAAGEAISITQLIAAAAPGATVTVPAGVYRERIVVEKPVTLIGEGNPVIDAGRDGDVVLVTADDVTLRGFTVQGSGRDVSLEPAGIRVRGNRAIIEGNVLRDILYGIVLEESSGHRVLNNSVSSIEEFNPERRGHALYLWHTDSNEVTGNTVTAAKDGIFLGFATHNHVQDNHVSGARYGIHYMYADHNSFVGNVFRESVAGAAIMFSRDITFQGNEFAYNRSAASGYGLLFKDVDDVEMTDNLVHHNRLGITLEGAPHSPGSHVTLRHNVISFNDTALSLSSTTAVVFTENTFMGNLEQVAVTGGELKAGNTWAVDGRGNYWDDYRGFDAGGDGVGDIPFRYEGAFDDLTGRNEWVRLYAYTPARNALDLAARWFPVYRPQPRVVDAHPLMGPLAVAQRVSDAARWPGVAASLGLVAVAAAALTAVRVQRRGWTA